MSKMTKLKFLARSIYDSLSCAPFNIGKPTLDELLDIRRIEGRLEDIFEENNRLQEALKDVQLLERIKTLEEDVLELKKLSGKGLNDV